ncbi:39S ribosomal protein L22, mitochondrial [Coemansia sp. RSA 2049]|nr:39S ribosomal protein L22, mitochondrial [Coemansia sp. RSA 2049]KAJ2522748.1 39S ribosomal protein L22, mitochondrial [Coemansia sp. RSA 1939]KAJ2617012.1 39S ribosomal protein L22, mitochondrial [Coemansia sp. RSA 1804]KAJ2694046.1 39S ribosomal protein L22, mitochondrial [Coemansia sp. RSA 1285]
MFRAIKSVGRLGAAAGLGSTGGARVVAAGRMNARAAGAYVGEFQHRQQQPYSSSTDSDSSSSSTEKKLDRSMKTQTEIRNEQSNVFVEAVNEVTKEADMKRVRTGPGKLGTERIREYGYSTKNFQVSPRKLRMLAKQITGQPVMEAIRQMGVSSKRAAAKIHHSLVWSRKNAVYQKQMNPDNMFVKLVRVGKGTYGKRLVPMARGRASMVRPPRAHMKYVLWERMPEEKPEPRNVLERALLAGRRPRRDVKGFKLTRNVWMPLRERRSVINAKQFYNW